MQNFKQKDANHFSYSLWMVLVLIFGCSCPMLAQNDSDPYNLSFRQEKGKAFTWAAMNSLYIGIDSTELVHGKYPFQWWGGVQLTAHKWSLSIYGVLAQRIPLPWVNDADTLAIELHNKTHNVEWATIVITSYGEYEDLLRKDSMNILSPEQWETHTLKIPCRNTRLVDIYISAVGFNDKAKTQKDLYQYVNLDELKIKIDNKDLYNCINDSSIKQNTDFLFIKEHIYPISKSHYKCYDQLQGKKIVGLGETMHKNASINQTVFDLCKYQITHNNTRILFIECPYHIGFKVNWYVTCDKATPKIKDSIKDDFKNGYFKSFFDFLDWLKEYNKTRERKVLIVGMDRLISQQYFHDPLAEVLNSLIPPASNTPQVTKIIDMLNKRQNVEALKEINQQKKLIISLLGETNGEMFINYAERLSKEFPRKFIDKQLIDLYNPQAIFFTRDQAMFKHVCEGIDMYLDSDETALVYGHLGHIDRGQEIYPYRNLGYQLNEKYKKDYFPIGITVGVGETTACITSSKKTQLTLPLDTPPENSIEHAAMETNHPEFFYLLQESNRSIAQIHDIMTTNNIDAYYANYQFKLISPKTRMDGLIFIRENYQETTRDRQDTP